MHKSILSEKNYIVIFGASGGAVKVAQTFKNIGLEFEFFVDNDKEKHGKLLEGKLIRKPEDLVITSIEYKIVIASLYYGEIEDQLIEMGIKKENIILKEQFIVNYIDDNMEKLVQFEPINYSDDKKIIIELSEGITLGGSEKWSITLGDALKKRNNNVILITTEGDNDITTNIQNDIHRFNLSYDRYIESIMELVDEIVSQLPCVVIINRISQVYMAAYIVKKYYGEQIKIVSVLHSDFVRVYKQNELLNNYVDTFFCVSNDVRNNFINNYCVNSSKVFFKDNPVKIDNNYIKNYSKPGEPIIIGYGARLEKAQKRADLLMQLIEKLEDMELLYILNIAGDGSYYNRIQEFILKKSLEHKVRLFGTIPFEKMNEFWKSCDIIVNLSDIEGIGLSMLEAMSVGTVPVVTDTAGAKSFITNDINGYVNNLGDINSIGECIKILSGDRKKLSDFGKISSEIIKSRCNLDDYIDYFNLIIDR